MMRAMAIALPLGLAVCVSRAAAQAAPPAPSPGAATNEAAAPPPPPLPGEAKKSRDAFEARLRDIDRRANQLKQTLGAAYAVQLKDLRASLQLRGRVRDMAIVHDEIVRFAKESTIPAPDAVKDPPELRKILEQLATQSRDDTHANEVEVVDSASRHLQYLGTLGVQMVVEEKTNQLAAVEAERDRIITHPRLRAALAVSATPPNRAAAGPIAVAVPSEDTTLDFHKIRMYSPSGEEADRVMGYSIDAAMWEDRTKMYQSKTEGSPKLGHSQSASGPVSYKLRMTVACRNREIAPDCRLVIEYFRRSLTDGSRAFISAEELKIPPIAKNESRTFEVKGVELTQSETRNVTLVGSNRTYSGHELHGFIVSLIGPSGKLMLQRFTPQSLGKDVVPTPGKRTP